MLSKRGWRHREPWKGSRTRVRAGTERTERHLGVERQRGRGGGEQDGFLWAAASGRARLLIGGDSGLERRGRGVAGSAEDDDDDDGWEERKKKGAGCKM